MTPSRPLSRRPGHRPPTPPIRQARRTLPGAACLIGALAAAAVHPASAQDLPGPAPNLEVIPAGSLVIPMDNAHQTLVAPFNIKAYGLVNNLLQNRIAVKWAIRAGKVKDGIDFTANAARIAPTAQAPASIDFRAGPFIVHRTYAAAALPLITAFGNNVVVYQLTQDATVDVRYTLTFRPKIAVNSVNSAIHTDILTRAGISNYDVVNDFSLLAGSCYTLACEPHNSSTAGVAAINGFVLDGGNMIAQCQSVDTYENNTPGGYLSTAGIVTNNLGNGLAYPNPDLSFSQYEGSLAASPGGAIEDWRLAAGSSLKANAHVHADNTGASPATWAATAQKTYFGGRGGMVFYLGGHQYGNADLAHSNGERMFLNAVMTPPTRPAACNLGFGIADAAVSMSHTGTFEAGGTGGYTIGVSNVGADTTVGATTVVDTLPTGLGYASASGSGWTFSVNGSIVTATYAAGIPPGGAASFVLTVNVDAAASPGVTNRAYVTAAGDVNAANDVASDPTTVVVLAIVKRAFRLDGTTIPNATVLPRGATFKFLIYVDNPGGALTDVSLGDVLDPAFMYLGGSIRTTNSPAPCASGTCTPAEEAAIFGAANSGTPGSDTLDGDPVSVSGAHVYVGDRVVANARLDLAAGKVYAVVFTVRLNELAGRVGAAVTTRSAEHGCRAGIVASRLGGHESEPGGAQRAIRHPHALDVPHPASDAQSALRRLDALADVAVQVRHLLVRQQLEPRADRQQHVLAGVNGLLVRVLGVPSLELIRNDRDAVGRERRQTQRLHQVAELEIPSRRLAIDVLDREFLGDEQPTQNQELARVVERARERRQVMEGTREHDGVERIAAVLEEVGGDRADAALPRRLNRLGRKVDRGHGTTLGLQALRHRSVSAPHLEDAARTRRQHTIQEPQGVLDRDVGRGHQPHERLDARGAAGSGASSTAPGRWGILPTHLTLLGRLVTERSGPPGVLPAGSGTPSASLEGRRRPR